ncbi:hypothetical protein AKO1_002285 [Acrasis kona]|uniref:KatG n=1 Tax=Acrasis kona TaxID=1008807 RepID=A0AAW2ZNQ2_9EUKA
MRTTCRVRLFGIFLCAAVFQIIIAVVFTMLRRPEDNKIPTGSIPDVPYDKAEVVIVVAGYLFDTSWVRRYLPEYSHVVYTKLDLASKYNVPHNKGKEAHIYLKFIIDHYHNLPNHTIFLHGHGSESWHDTRLYRTIKNLDYNEEYKNLNWHHHYDLERDWKDEYEKTRDHWPEVFVKYGIPFPERICYYCCAQFMVSKEAILRRPFNFYKEYYDWMADTQVDDYYTSRISEYTWHMVFGQDPVQKRIKWSQYFDNLLSGWW